MVVIVAIVFVRIVSVPSVGVCILSGMRQVGVNGWIVSSRRNDVLGKDDALDVGDSVDKSLGVNEAEKVVSTGSSAQSDICTVVVHGKTFHI